MNHWLCMITSLPTENTALRQRTWRALKASGAAVLRDGVYLMPEREDCRATLGRLSQDVRNGGGTALVLRVEEPVEAAFKDQFDRSSRYAALLAEIAEANAELTAASAAKINAQARKLRKTYSAVAGIDFFPGEAQRQVDLALTELQLACIRATAPDEPHDVAGTISERSVTDYRGKTWATRQRPWVDRLASAWLIRRFIDPQAQILWLDSPDDCPVQALGFDFDGATFSHVGGKVTFEVLMASFRLTEPGLARLGTIVHYLDVGGAPQPEAPGVESVLAGLRDTIADDDELLAAACAVFDGLHAGLEKGVARP